MVVQSIPLITDLRTQNRNIGILYVATGQTTQGDNNGGMYMWNPSSTAADDSFYVIQVTGVATGRWLRIGAASNIYTANGSLINNRTVTLNGFTLSFAGSTYSSTYNADGTVTLGSLVGTGTRYVVAGPTGLLGATGTIPTPGTPTRFVETFTASAGQTIFNTANTLFTYFFDVYVNGVLLDNTSFTASANQVILTDPCSLNDIVQIIGFYNITYVGTLPPQAGNAGRFLTTDGTSLSWGVNPLGTVTSVDMSVPTGFAITGNPITSAGTLALGFAAGYSLPSNSVQANWTTAYNRSLTSAAVTGTSTKTLTLNEQDGSTIIATWSDYDTQGVTSVSVNVGNTGTDVNANVVNPTTTPTININVPSASATVRGALTSTDWTTFNSKQAAITLTTVGSSGAATFIANVLNIPDYGGALSGYVPTSRQLTINGTAYDLSADRSWSVGTVTSVNMSVPTGFAIANNPITTSGTLALSYAAGYALPTTASQGNWDTAYTFVSNFPSQTGNAGKYLTTDGSVLSWAVLNLANYVPTSRTLTINGVTYDLSADRTWTIVAGVSSVAGTAPISAVNVSGAVTISISQSSASTDGYLSSTDWTTFNSKQPAGNYITSLTGEATASGPGAASVTLTNSAVIGKVLTGLNVTGGSISATDSILAAFGKIQNQINGLIGGLQYQGTWNASTNTPTLTSGVGTNGYFYIVSVAGSTNLDGITDWKVGDWAVYHASTWQKVDNTESVTSVNGFTGAVSLTTSNISEGTNLYFTDLRARQAISLTTTGTSGAATYDNTTGVLNIPQYQGGVTSFNTRTGAITLLDTDVTGALGYTPVTNARTLTINGTTFDLTANRTWSVGTVTSVGLTMPSAFTVTNSPVTGSGTLTVTAAGLASQYVRGDGTLGDFPAGGGGGGASVSYYLNGSVNQGTFGGNTYYEMSKTPVIGLGTDFTISSNGYIASFITDANDPALLLIPGGNFNLEFYFSASSGGGAPSYYVELYKYDGTTFTLIASNSVNPDIITSGTATEAYFTSLSVPETVITATDRLAVRIYVTPAGRTITLHTEDNNLCQVITTFTTGLTALNGLTKQVQYFAVGTSGTDFAISSSVDTHTFNLPTASATNRGALSSADWTTFNSKQAALNGTGFVKISGTTISYDNSTYLTTSSAASTYVPYTGATTNVDLGFNNLDANQINGFQLLAKLNGTGSSPLILRTGTSGYSYGNDAISLISSPTSANTLTIISDVSEVLKIAEFSLGSLTATRTYTLPDTSGTLALGTGTTNTLPKFTGASTIGNSNITDTGSLITLGSNSYVNGSVGIGVTPLTHLSLRVNKNLTGNVISTGISQAGTVQSDVTTIGRGIINTLITQATSFTLPDYFHFLATQGTIGAGSSVTSQIGYYVDNTLTGATSNFGFRGSIPSGTNRWNIYMDGTANNYMAGSLGIGTSSLTGFTLYALKNITGATNSYGIAQGGVVQSDVTNSANGYLNNASTAATSFTLATYRHFWANQGTFGAGSTVTAQYGFLAGNTLIGATNNYGFYGDIPSGTNRWNLYMNGTAANYLAGSLGIGTTTLTGFKLNLGGSITGAVTTFNVNAGGTIQSDVTANHFQFQSSVSTAAAAFTLGGLYHFRANQGTIGATSAITNQYGYVVESNLTGATNNYGFWGGIASGTNRWNLYMAGTANNYMAGALGIGTTTLTGYNINVNKSLTGATTSISIQNTGAIQSDVTSNAYYYSTFASTQATTFTLANLAYYRAHQGTFGLGSTVTTQSGFVVESSLTGATNNYGFRGAIPSGTNRWNIYMDGTANNYMAGSLGIGSTSLSLFGLRVSKTITGGTIAYNQFNDGSIQSDVTSEAMYYSTNATTSASAFTLTNLFHYRARYNVFGAGSTVTNQYGYFVDSTLTAATNNYAFWGAIPSGTNRWNLYMAGTAANYMAGQVGIGTTNIDEQLTVSGNIHVDGSGSGSGTFGPFVEIGRGNGPRIQATQEGADNDIQGLAIFTKNSGVTADNPTERIRVKATGQMRFVPLASDPSGAEAGDVYYNSTISALKLYDGTVWRTITVV